VNSWVAPPMCERTTIGCSSASLGQLLERLHPRWVVPRAPRRAPPPARPIGQLSQQGDSGLRDEPLTVRRDVHGSERGLGVTFKGAPLIGRAGRQHSALPPPKDANRCSEQVRVGGSRLALGCRPVGDATLHGPHPCSRFWWQKFHMGASTAQSTSTR
jgi:hypothetical protein